MGQRVPRSPRPVRIERTVNGDVEQAWELWTTRDGIEAWWGPEGFAVKVGKLDLRAGGELLYAMTAIAAEQVDFLKKAGMPITMQARVTYTEVTPPRRLAFRQVADFIPGVKAYEVAHMVEFDQVPGGVRMVLTMDAMHDEHWTRLAVMGWESELGKLAALLARRP